MINDAEKYQEADKERKETIENANRADSTVNDTEAALKEHGSGLDQAEADAIREKITALRETVAKAQSGDGTITAAQLKEQTDGLRDASLTLFDKMYRAQSQDSDSSTGPASGGKSQDSGSSTGPESGEKKE